MTKLRVNRSPTNLPESNDGLCGQRVALDLGLAEHGGLDVGCRRHFPLDGKGIRAKVLCNGEALLHNVFEICRLNACGNEMHQKRDDAATNAGFRLEYVAEHGLSLLVIGHESKELLVLDISARVRYLTDWNLHE